MNTDQISRTIDHLSVFRYPFSTARALFLLFTFSFLLSTFAFPQRTAPGAPGADAQWATAAKQAVGTSATSESKVWFTLANGVLTEVYYPNVATPNVHLLQFIVVDPNTKTVETGGST